MNEPLLTKEKILVAKKLYTKGLSLQVLSVGLKVSIPTLKEALLAAGTVLRPSQKKRPKRQR